MQESRSEACAACAIRELDRQLHFHCKKIFNTIQGDTNSRREHACLHVELENRGRTRQETRVKVRIWKNGGRFIVQKLREFENYEQMILPDMS